MKNQELNSLITNTQLSWIHLQNLKFFVFLGATEAEQLIGQNITLHLSLCIPYTNTKDKLKNTIDYGKVYECVVSKIETLSKNRVQLMEYFVEQILNEIENKFRGIHAIKIAVEKGYVPLKNFAGMVKFEVEKKYTI